MNKLLPLCAGQLLVLAAQFMLIPLLMKADGGGMAGASDSWRTFGAVMPLLAAGALGPLYGWFTDGYRRVRTATLSILVQALLTLSLPYLPSPALHLSVRLLQGAVLGVSLMSVGSVLSINICPSEERGRNTLFMMLFTAFAWVVGLLAGSILCTIPGFGQTSGAFAASLMNVAALLLVRSVKIPFRAPLGVSLFSYDRFLAKGHVWGLLLTALSLLPVGLMAGMASTPWFFTGMSVGIALKMLCRKRQPRPLYAALAGVAVSLLYALAGQTTGLMADLPMGIFAGYLFSHLFAAGYTAVSERVLHCERSTASTSIFLATLLGGGLGLWVGLLEKSAN